MPEAFVGVGSNSDPGAALRFAIATLTQRFGAPVCSAVYRSAAVGVAAADYLNLVVALTTDIGVVALRAALASIETAAGRQRDDPKVVRLDLDLLLYGMRVDAELGVPRPDAFRLPYVLGPLAEIAPALVHPLTGQSCEAAWQAVAPGGLTRIGSVALVR